MIVRLAQWWQALRVRAIKLRIYLFTHVPIHTKCPACGYVRDHKMVWSALQGILVRQCAVCTAVWGQAPVLQVGAWAAAAPEAAANMAAAVKDPPDGTVKIAPRAPTFVSTQVRPN